MPHHRHHPDRRTCLFQPRRAGPSAGDGTGWTGRQARLADNRRVTRAGKPVWVERQRLDQTFLHDSEAPALLAGARAFAVVALVMAGAEDALAPVRAVLDEPGCSAAASGWEGKCLVRVTAPDGWPLKRQLARVLAVLSGRPLPRVWQMQGVAP